eukprot:g20084.t1
MATIRQRIAGRSLTPGAKLPSVRALAATLGVSTSTVVDAYERLVAEGSILSRPGSGFYVASLAAPFSPAQAGPKLDRAVDPFWISRQSLESGSDSLKPGCGWLPPTWLPEEMMRKALRTLSRSEPSALADYGTPLGLPALRRLIARRMAERGVEASPDQVLLTESGTLAIDLICRFLIEPGDTVMVDDPCYFNFHALLRAHRAKIVSVPYTPSGPDVAAFAETVSQHRPRLYITNSAIHNPTGAVLSPVMAHRVLKIAEEFDLTIIEDDIFADFEAGGSGLAPRLAAFDGLERVIHIGSFSKTLSAAARCGFIAARPGWIEGLTDLKIATSFAGGRLTEEVVHSVLSDGGYRKHLEILRARLSKAMAEAADRLATLAIVPVLRPQAGMFLCYSLFSKRSYMLIHRHSLEGKSMKGLFVLAASVALTASSAAFAADAVEQIPTAPVAVETMPAFTWSGPYIGVHTGYGWGDGEIEGVGSDDFDGWRLGGFVGYNWQFSNGFVAGIEGDVNYDWNDNDYGGGVEAESGFSGSVRGRVGYAFDRALLYAAGGWTATNVSLDTPAGDDDDTLHGWTIGAGVDYAFTDNMFGRLEYRYNDFSDGDLGGADVDFDQHIVQIGLAVKF